ncbi:MAG: VOC family protein [Gemmatimonadaceae bacterium]
MIVNRSAPTATVVPILVYEDVEAAIDFLVGAFGFAEHIRARGPDGRVNHAQLRIADGTIIVGRQGGPFRTPRPREVTQLVHVTVADADAHFRQAERSGARIVQAPHDMPFGERQYTAEDLGGHWWVFSQHIADVAPADWGATEVRDHLGSPAAS